MRWSLIAALGEKNEIGAQGDMPWRLKDDLKLFKTITNGHALLMGRKTFESLPGILPNRHHFVLTRDPSKFQNTSQVTYLSSADELPANLKEIFLIGGGQIYQNLWNKCECLHLTFVKGHFPSADTFFPQIDFSHFTQVEERYFEKDDSNNYDFVYRKYQKSASAN